MKDEREEELGRRLMEALADVPNPRSLRGIRHPLAAIMAMSVCAMLGGARSLYAIAQWGREQTPCVATLHHVFRRLDVDAFEGALSAWAQGSLQEGDEAIAVDGKALRGIHGDELPGVRLVAAYAHRSGLAVGQKGGEE